MANGSPAESFDRGEALDVSSKPRRCIIDVLQAGRAVAALAVVVHHAAASTESFTKGIPPTLQWLASYGYLGVDFFFVLSGFIIYHTRGKSLERYARSRLARIFAPYLPVGVGIALAYTFFPFVSAGNRQWSWWATLTLLPIGGPALIVAWTLQYELVFYFVFGLFYRRPVSGMVGFGVLAAIASLWSRELLLVVEFLFGVLAAVAIEKRWGKQPLLFASAGFIIDCFLGERIVFGLTMAFLVVALVRAEASERLRTPQSLSFLGAASYSIYLVHNPLCALAARLFDSWLFAFVSALLLGTIGGIAYHLWIEVPLLKLLRPARSQAPFQRDAPPLQDILHRTSGGRDT
jgi:peptidoglycan/LPS O-acetylase OafA/YrhL